MPQLKLQSSFWEAHFGKNWRFAWQKTQNPLVLPHWIRMLLEDNRFFPCFQPSLLPTWGCPNCILAHIPHPVCQASLFLPWRYLYAGYPLCGQCPFISLYCDYKNKQRDTRHFRKFMEGTVLWHNELSFSAWHQHRQWSLVQVLAAVLWSSNLLMWKMGKKQKLAQVPAPLHPQWKPGRILQCVASAWSRWVSWGPCGVN